MPSGEWRPRPDDGGTVAGPGPDASQAEPDIAEAFETTRAVVEPLLAQNDSDFQEEQFRLALNQETGDAILYLPHSGTTDVEQLAADAIAAAQATPGAAPVVPVIGVALIDELDAVSVRLFASRAEWATDPADVYWTIPEPNTASVASVSPNPRSPRICRRPCNSCPAQPPSSELSWPSRLSSNNTARTCSDRRSGH